LDAQFDAYASEEKINRPQLDTDGEKLAEQTARFRSQIEGARRNHTKAKRYLAVARRQHHGLAFELAYRNVHASFKIFSWRSQILRYAAILAHYMPGLEIACLPRPCMPTPVVDFLHYSVPPEGYYALAAVSGMGVKPSFDHLLRFSARRTFQGQKTKDLEFEAIHQTGMAELMLQISSAQVHMMEMVLDLESVFYNDEKRSRYDYRTEGIYAEFWDILHLRYSPNEWRKVARKTLNDSNRPVGNLGVLSFAEFLRANSDRENPQ
jgi:hypothetical protein